RLMRLTIRGGWWNEEVASRAVEDEYDRPSARRNELVSRDAQPSASAFCCASRLTGSLGQGDHELACPVCARWSGTASRAEPAGVAVVCVPAAVWVRPLPARRVHHALPELQSPGSRPSPIRDDAAGQATRSPAVGPGSPEAIGSRLGRLLLGVPVAAALP